MSLLIPPPDDPTWLGFGRRGWVSHDHHNPFLRFRSMLTSYQRAAELGWSDDQFVDLVNSLDDALAEVADHGFSLTPMYEAPELATAVGHRGRLWIKDETGNVTGSHKSRHLFGLALHLAVEDVPLDVPLAIASCGNAALAASAIARAASRPLEVFVPDWAEGWILDRLDANGAQVSVCSRDEGELGDPCHRRFREAVASGALPFGCQGPDEPRTLDGGRTLGWEIVEEIPSCDRVVIHVGGGALASSVAQALAGAVASEQWVSLPTFDTVQTQGCAPLAAAMDRLAPQLQAGVAFSELDTTGAMQPWPTIPTSLADGILDDVTYDWIVLAWMMLATGGRAIVAPEQDVRRAHHLAQQGGHRVSATGSAGLAGLLAQPEPDAETVVVFSGVG